MISAYACYEYFPLPVIVKSADTGITLFANREAFRLFHLKEDQWIGLRDEDVFPAATASVWRERENALRMSQTSMACCEDKLLMHGRGLRWIYSRRVLMVSPENNEACFLIVHEDITDRKKQESIVNVQLKLLEASEAARHENEAFMNEVLNLLPVAVLIVDEESNRIEFANSMAVMFFAPTTDLVGREFPRHLFTILSKGEADWTLRSEDGKERPVLRLIRSVSLGGRSQRLEMIADISEQMQLQNEKKRLENQVIHAAKLASIGTLAAGMAHEINNPLTVVRGNISLIRETISKMSDSNNEFTETLDACLSMQDRSAKRIASIVQSLRAYARMDSDILEAVDVHRCISDTLQMCDVIYEKEGIRIDVILRAHRPFIRANAGRLQQVILNLISNARDALEHVGGERVITIQTEETSDSLLIHIVDNGHGISSEHLARIFDPFFTTRPVGKGTGLGLSISHSIVELFSGRIDVSSSLGHGARFSLSFPKTVENVVLDHETNHVSSDYQLTGRVLLVDDEDDIRVTMGQMLRSWGLDVEIASNGLEGLAIMQRQGPGWDLIITDLKMPKMNGERFIREVIAINAGLAPILIITGTMLSDYTPDQRMFLERYSKEIIRKPFSREDVFSVLSKYLKVISGS